MLILEVVSWVLSPIFGKSSIGAPLKRVEAKNVPVSHYTARALRALGQEPLICGFIREMKVRASGLEGRLQPPTLAPVNPTGAGDALAAGLLAGHLRGGSFLEIATLGMAAAAASVRHGYGRIRPTEVQTKEGRFEEL